MSLCRDFCLLLCGLAPLLTVSLSFAGKAAEAKEDSQATTHSLGPVASHKLSYEGPFGVVLTRLKVGAKLLASAQQLSCRPQTDRMSLLSAETEPFQLLADFHTVPW